MHATISEEMEQQPESDNSDIPEDNLTPNTPTLKVDISLANAVSFLQVRELPGTWQFMLNLKDISTWASFMSDSTPPDLSFVLEEYHDFADVVNKAKADMLASHRPYNLKINLEEGSTPPLGQMYSLSQTEFVALREFIDKHLATGFIRPSRSPYSAPVLWYRENIYLNYSS